MSRHRNIRALNYDDEYDDYYQDDYDDYDDFLEAPRLVNNNKKQANTSTSNQKQTQLLSKNNVTKNQQKSTSKVGQQNDKIIKNQQNLTSKPSKNSTSSTTLQSISNSNNKNDQKQHAFKNNLPNTKHVQDLEKLTNEYEEFVKCSKPRVNLIVVGHVDAGKSTLVGRFLCDNGSLTQKQIHKNEVESQKMGKASFRYAWALDETNEERQRGVTIDLAFTKFETKNRVIVVLDSPGHVDFIPAVISGAAQADAAILVVDACVGAFETGFEQGGQTKEHAFLVRSLGVRSLIVVVNKMDMTDWNWERYSEIKSKLGTFLKLAGFNLKEDVQFVAVSSLTGENLLKRRRHNLNLSNSSHPQLESQNLKDWNKELSLTEALDKLPTPKRLIDYPTRVVVNDVYKGMTGGVFLNAKVSGGKVHDKQILQLLPPNESCEVKSVEIKDCSGGSIPTGKAYAGDIVTLVANGIDFQKFYRGCILCDPTNTCHVTNRFQARIIMFQGVDSFLVRGTSVEVHMNGTYESGEVRKLISLVNKSSGEVVRRKPKCIPRNSSAVIQLRLSRPIGLELYSDNKDLGTLMLRSLGKTIAAGLVTKIKASKVISLVKLKTK